MWLLIELGRHVNHGEMMNSIDFGGYRSEVKVTMGIMSTVGCAGMLRFALLYLRLLLDHTFVTITVHWSICSGTSAASVMLWPQFLILNESFPECHAFPIYHRMTATRAPERTHAVPGLHPYRVVSNLDRILLWRSVATLNFYTN